jgi:hypothetical protein
MNNSRFGNVTLLEAPVRGGAYGYVKNNGAVKCVLFGRKRIRRAREVFNLMRAKNADFSKLDDRFFTVLSLYLSEEKYLNAGLLRDELRRLS